MSGSEIVEGVENTGCRQIVQGALLQKGAEMEQNLAGRVGSFLSPSSSSCAPFPSPYLPCLTLEARSVH